MQKKTYLVLCVALTVILGGFLLLHTPQKADNPASQAADTHETTDNQREKENNPNPSKSLVEEEQEITRKENELKSPYVSKAALGILVIVTILGFGILLKLEIIKPSYIKTTLSKLIKYAKNKATQTFYFIKFTTFMLVLYIILPFFTTDKDLGKAIPVAALFSYFNPFVFPYVLASLVFFHRRKRTMQYHADKVNEKLKAWDAALAKNDKLLLDNLNKASIMLDKERFAPLKEAYKTFEHKRVKIRNAINAGSPFKALYDQLYNLQEDMQQKIKHVLTNPLPMATPKDFPTLDISNTDLTTVRLNKWMKKEGCIWLIALTSATLGYALLSFSWIAGVFISVALLVNCVSEMFNNDNVTKHWIKSLLSGVTSA